MKKVKRHPTKRKNVQIMYMIKDLYLEYIKNLIIINTANNPNKKRGNDLKRYFSKENI